MIEFTDRYKALGIPYPEKKTMCMGRCEGTGHVPIHRDDPEEPFHSLWLEEEARVASDDGWHFIRCPECNGTGKRALREEER